MSSLLPVITSWDGYDELFTKVEVFGDAVREICSRHDLKAREVSAGFPGTCPVFLVDGTHVVKLFPPMVASDQPREVFCYSQLKGKDDLIPEMVASGLLGDRVDWPYLVTEYREGVAIRDVVDDLTESEKTNIAWRVAETVRMIHSIDVEGTGDRFRAWKKFIDQQVAGVVDAHSREGGLPDTVCGEIPAFLTRIANCGPGATFLIGPRNSRAVAEGRILINADLTEDHLLLVKRDGRYVPSAVIDFADAEVGDVAYEWVALCLGMFDGDPVMIRAFFDAYNGERIDRAWREQMFAWTLVHRFGPEIVASVLKRRRQGKIRGLDELMQVLWPSELDHI